MIIDDIKNFALNIKSDIFFDFDIKKLNWFLIWSKTKIFLNRILLKN